jgi:hypothetical protein
LVGDSESAIISLNILGFLFIGVLNCSFLNLDKKFESYIIRFNDPRKWRVRYFTFPSIVIYTIGNVSYVNVARNPSS